MLIKVILVDINAKVVAAWKDTFANNEEVEIVMGSVLEQTASAWVSPTNSRGSMDGGLDAVIKKFLGPGIEKALQAEIARNYGGHLPVGHAVSVSTGRDLPKFLISTPTMSESSQDISATMNVALACAAAFQAVHMRNRIEPGAIRSVVLPGLGANTGRVPASICADLMWTGYRLFRDREFESFAEMRAALEAELGTLEPMESGPMKGGNGKGKAGAAAGGLAAAAAMGDDDFDDGDDSEEDDEKSVSDEDFEDA